MPWYEDNYLDDATAEAIEAGRVDWGAGGRVHNWRRYVGERTQALWPTLTRDQRVAVVLDANDRAGNEDWE